MDEDDIHILFSSVAESTEINEPAREVFSALIKTTLRYRDHLKKFEDIIVTVEDVRTALDWLVPTLKTGRLPETGNKRSLGLLKLWLDELRTTGYP